MNGLHPVRMALAMLSLPFACAAASAAEHANDDAPLIAACEACHGRDAIGASTDIPELAGQKRAYLARQLRAFRQGDRKNDLMAAIAAQLSDEEIESLAAQWSARPRTPDVATTTLPNGMLLSAMRFPAAFPRGFEPYLVTLDAESGQVSRRYVNATGLQALREGRPLPSGTVIIVAFHRVQRDNTGKPMLDAQGDPAAGPPLSYAGMELRSDWGKAVPRLLRNADWNYTQFDAERMPRSSTNQAPCLACHKPRAADEYIFSMGALRSVASSGPARNTLPAH